MVRFITAALLAALSAFVVADDTVTCSPTQKCPADKPCCSREFSFSHMAGHMVDRADG